MTWEQFDVGPEPWKPVDGLEDYAVTSGGPANPGRFKVATVSHRPEPPEARAGDALGLLERPDWHYLAACRGVFDFFDRPAVEQAERCAVCPVQAECKAAGANEVYGVWGNEEKVGLAPVVDVLADRIIDLVTTRPYSYTMRGIEANVRGCAVRRIRAMVKVLVADGRIGQYEALKGSGRGRAWTILYGPGEVRP